MMIHELAAASRNPAALQGPFIFRGSGPFPRPRGKGPTSPFLILLFPYALTMKRPWLPYRVTQFSARRPYCPFVVSLSNHERPPRFQAFGQGCRHSLAAMPLTQARSKG